MKIESQTFMHLVALVYIYLLQADFRGERGIRSPPVPPPNDNDIMNAGAQKFDGNSTYTTEFLPQEIPLKPGKLLYCILLICCSVQ